MDFNVFIKKKLLTKIGVPEGDLDTSWEVKNLVSIASSMFIITYY